MNVVIDIKYYDALFVYILTIYVYVLYEEEI